jgi:hypothetical protein
MLRVGEKEPFVLFGVGSRWSLGALDLSTDRAAFYDENGYCLARTEQRTVFAFHTRECGAPGELWLERGRERAVAVSFGGEVTSVELYDTALEKELAGVGVGDFVEMVAFIPGSDLVLLAASELYIWDPGSAEVLEWQPPAQLENVSVNALGVDPNGSALALGFVNGDVAWLTLDTLRAQTHAADPELVAELPARVNCDKPLATSFAAMTSDDELPPEPSVGDAGEEGAE